MGGSFMQPETLRTAWLRIETTEGGESVLACAHDVSAQELEAARRSGSVDELGTMWCARLSAPGYLDATDWIGPFETESEALAELARMHDMCAHCFECTADDGPESMCNEALAESLRGNVCNATSEALRGRGRAPHNRWIGDAIGADVRELFGRCGAQAVRRAAVLGINEARRALFCELAEHVRALARNVPGAIESAQARFPALFHEGR
jgi:hypothetical protein